ncbi:MAG: hypothetical protein EZS28_016465 [Streblomastix strix]|uniref:Armadillo-type fold n=1 Tax=Streblomastix strix TaxID=222440 RepID=A0A5J4VZL2_9EUKA|nr:MAG: hypothetical protein EZS28_016465 [Streblomastix strix]
MSEDSNIINIQEITNILKLPLIGTEEEINITIQKQENVCHRFINKLKDKTDDLTQTKVITSDVASELSNIFETRDLNHITLPFIEAFLNISNSQDTENIQSLIYTKKNPYPGFIRLLQHQDEEVVLSSFKSIENMLEGCINKIEGSQIHPHYQQFVDCNGIQKLFSFFQQTSNKKLKDAVSICIGKLFIEQEIPNKDIRAEIMPYLKSILTDEDEWTCIHSRRTLSFLAMNRNNRFEIINEDQLEIILQDLEQPLEGSDEERKFIQQKQIYDCIILSSALEMVKNDDLIDQTAEIKIVKALLHIFETRDLNAIQQELSQAFENITRSSDDDEENIYFEIPFKGLIRLLDHSDKKVVDNSINSIFNILNPKTNSTSDQTHNQHFNALSKCQGIERLFDLFRKEETNQNSKMGLSFCIGIAFRGRMIENPAMRVEIINYIKDLINNSDISTSRNAKFVLSYISLNAGNHDDILKNNFLANVNTIFSLRNTDSQGLFDLLNMLRYIIEFGTDQTQKYVKESLPMEIIRQFTHDNDSQVKKGAFHLMSWVLNAKEMIQLQKLKEIINQGLEQVDIEIAYDEIMNEITNILQNGMNYIDEQGGLILVALGIAGKIIQEIRYIDQDQFKQDGFIDSLFKFYTQIPHEQIICEFTDILTSLIISSTKDQKLILKQEKYIVPLVHLFDSNIAEVALHIIRFLTFILLQINENGEIQQEDEFRSVLERKNALHKLEQIFSADNFKGDDIQKYSAIVIASLYKAIKMPDEFRLAVINCLNDLVKYSYFQDFIEFSALALSRLAECEENHSDIISGDFPSTLRLYIESDYYSATDNGLSFALNLLRFGSEETVLKVKEGISLDYIRDLYLNPDEDQPETTAFSAKLLDAWMLTIS